MSPSKAKIAVLIEEHFDGTEYRRFNDFFPQHGYQVEYVSHLWGQPSLTFGNNPDDGTVDLHVKVTTEINNVRPQDYAGVILIGAYAMDRMRYQEKVKPGQPNQAPAVRFLRQAMQQGVPVGTICHSLWLLCADPALLKGRKVTCAHNIICDVENAGGQVVYEGDQSVDIVVDGNLISGKHPAVVDLFMQTFVEQMDHRAAAAAAR
jgi:putative intracellular protease/amidase